MAQEQCPKCGTWRDRKDLIIHSNICNSFRCPYCGFPRSKHGEQHYCAAAQYEAHAAEAARSLAINERYWRRLQIRTTLEHLKRCRAARAAGQPVSFTTDPAWLVEQAINRRAGWPDDPSCSRGSCMPVCGTYPKKASGDTYNHLRTLSRKINANCVVHNGELGKWRRLLIARIPERIET